MSIKGEVVRRLLIAEAAEIQAEYYLAFTLDRQVRQMVAIASASGGIDIEEVARTTPERIVKMHVDAFIGFQSFHARELAVGIGLRENHLTALAGIAAKIGRAHV